MIYQPKQECMIREQMTVLEAISAMKQGWFYEDDGGTVSRIYNGQLEYWTGSEWKESDVLSAGGGLVPDPSKYKKKASEEAWGLLCDKLGLEMLDAHSRGHWLDVYRAVIDCAKCEMREEMEGK